MSRVPKKCPLCGDPYMAERQLFATSYDHDACEKCIALAIENSRKGRDDLERALKGGQS